jgi:hypothetical protein
LNLSPSDINFPGSAIAAEKKLAAIIRDAAQLTIADQNSAHYILHLPA